ncbi:hypothetical protein B0H13DRAFT_2014137, partial [Mycena leptocephala]
KFRIASTSSTPVLLRARLAEIDAEMADLHARLRDLAIARKPVVDALKSIIYPPLLLASVCKAWRCIALTLPTIWSDIEMFRSSDSSSRIEKLLPCWLPRVGGHPLKVDMASGKFNRIFAALAPYSMQWHTSPLARKFRLCPENVDLTPITAFSDAPNLREVKLIIVSTHPLSMLISLPWRQLTHLHCRGQFIAQCMALLALTPHLETFSVGMLSIKEEPLPASIQLDHLHTLKLLDPASWHLLDCLTLPSLKRLELEDLNLHQLSKLLPFLSQSGSSLRSIVSRRTAVWSIVEATLRTALKVSEPNMTDFARAWDIFFSHVRTDPNFLPNLQILSVEAPKPDFLSQALCNEIVEMLVSRWHGRSPGSTRLESFQFVYDSPYDSSAHLFNTPDAERCAQTVRTLTAEGCKIHIQSLGSSGKSDRNPSYTLDSLYEPSFPTPLRYS